MLRPFRHRWSEENLLKLGAVLVLVALWSAVVAIGWQRATLERRERAALTASTAKGFAEYVALHLMAIDHTLQRSREEFARTGKVASHAELAADLGPMTAPMLVQIGFADQDGRVIASSLPLAGGVSIADRPVFAEIKRDPRDRVLLTEPVVGRVSGKMSLHLVRPVLGPHGEFRGTAAASIDPAVLQRYFGSLDAFANGGMVNIVGRDDGVIRTRFTATDISWGQSLLGSPAWPQPGIAGRFEVRSVLDGITRVVGFHQVEGFPLVVTVGAKRPSWFNAEMMLAIALAIGLTYIKLRYVAARLQRLREKELLIEQLAEASRMKSRFIASVSHELRTPLNSILGFSELLRDMPGHPDSVRRAELIHGSGQHLHKLLNTLLDLAKIEAGRMPVQRAELDVLDMVRTAVETHCGSAARKGLEMSFESDIPPDAVVLADTDPTKLLQVLNNVFHNAVKFTPAGSVRVKARLDDGTFVVVVDDTGCGISPERLQRIFEHFSSGDDGPGTGLGLALSRELMHLLGGTIQVSSQAGAGTRATLRLPGARLAEVLAA